MDAAALVDIIHRLRVDDSEEEDGYITRARGLIHPRSSLAWLSAGMRGDPCTPPLQTMTDVTEHYVASAPLTRFQAMDICMAARVWLVTGAVLGGHAVEGDEGKQVMFSAIASALATAAVLNDDNLMCRAVEATRDAFMRRLATHSVIRYARLSDAETARLRSVLVSMPEWEAYVLEAEEYL